MRRCGVRFLTLMALVALAGWPPAGAQIRTPSISCAVNDHSLALDLYAPLNPDGSGTLGRGGLQGSLEIHHYLMAKERRRWPLDGRQPTQQGLL